MTKTLIVIPARLASTRLPNKPLAKIDGIPMICQVVNRAREAEIGEIIVATDSIEIKEIVEENGAKAIMTSHDHVSGSDRIWEAVKSADPGASVDFVINLQGDLPTISGDLIRKSIIPLRNKNVDIATLGVEIKDEEEKTNPNVVKIVGTPTRQGQLRALYFTRATAPFGEGPLYHHIGLYAYRRASLKKFVTLKPSVLEQREKLEQLRALENDMRIEVQLVDEVPHGVDTPEDLEVVRKHFNSVSESRDE